MSSLADERHPGRFPPVRHDHFVVCGAHGMAGMSLRWLGEDDVSWLRDLHASTREDEMAPVPWPPAQKRAFLDQQWDAQHRHYLQVHADADFLAICDVADRPLGRLYLRRGATDHLIVDISLFPFARGQGIGTALILAVQRQAAAQGCGLSLSVLQQNPAAWRLYERLGFVAVDAAPPYVRMAWRAAPGTSVS